MSNLKKYIAANVQMLNNFVYGKQLKFFSFISYYIFHKDTTYKHSKHSKNPDILNEMQG